MSSNKTAQPPACTARMRVIFLLQNFVQHFIGATTRLSLTFLMQHAGITLMIFSLAFHIVEMIFPMLEACSELDAVIDDGG